MREIRTLRATWRGLETWPSRDASTWTGAPVLDPTCGRLEVRFLRPTRRLTPPLWKAGRSWTARWKSGRERLRTTGTAPRRGADGQWGGNCSLKSVDAQQCLGFVPGNVLAARIFI
jgi:hypothetical protein